MFPLGHLGGSASWEFGFSSGHELTGPEFESHICSLLSVLSLRQILCPPLSVHLPVQALSKVSIKKKMFPSSYIAGLSFVIVILNNQLYRWESLPKFYSTVLSQCRKKKSIDINMKVLFLNSFQKELFSFMIWAKWFFILRWHKGSLLEDL